MLLILLQFKAFILLCFSGNENKGSHAHVIPNFATWFAPAPRPLSRFPHPSRRYIEKEKMMVNNNSKNHNNDHTHYQGSFARQAILFDAVENNDTTTTTTTTRAIKRAPSSTAIKTGNDRNENKKQRSLLSRMVVPFLRVEWNNKKQRQDFNKNQWNSTNNNDNTTTKEEEEAEGNTIYEPIDTVTFSPSIDLRTHQSVGCSTQSHLPPLTLSSFSSSDGNHTKNKNATSIAVLTTNNNNNNNNSIMNRTHTTPIPVAESILRSIYDQASESAKEMVAWSGNPVVEMSLWNTSQFFPTMIPGIIATATTTTSSSSSNNNQSLLAISDKKKSTTTVITVEDLERILQEKGFVRQSDVVEALQRANLDGTSVAGVSVDTASTTKPKKSLIEGLGQPVGDLLGGTAVTTPMPPSRSSTSSSQVAFPQPSVLNYKSLKWGVAVASFVTCTVLATSVMPSLWLVGGLVGSLYGYQTGNRLADGTVPTSFFPSFLLMFGQRIAKSYLQVYDMVTALFFMYKTGQLSYSMWRRYADLDGRFQIQDKIDAWVR